MPRLRHDTRMVHTHAVHASTRSFEPRSIPPPLQRCVELRRFVCLPIRTRERHDVP